MQSRRDLLKALGFCTAWMNVPGAQTDAIVESNDGAQPIAFVFRHPATLSEHCYRNIRYSAEEYLCRGKYKDVPVIVLEDGMTLDVLQLSDAKSLEKLTVETEATSYAEAMDGGFMHIDEVRREMGKHNG